MSIEDDQHGRLIAELFALNNELDDLAVRDFHTSIADVPLTMRQLKVLSLIVHGKGHSAASDIAEVLQISLATVSGILDRLEEHGMVARKPDPDDRRAKLLEASEAGREMLFRLINRSQELSQVMLQRMTVDELESLVMGLKGLSRVMRND